MMLSRMASKYLTPADIFAGFIACIAHDVDHPGVTTEFLMAIADPVVTLYNNISPMEMHHCAIAVRMMQTPRCSFLSDVSTDDYNYFIEAMTQLILATDMKKHGEQMVKLRLLLDRDIHRSRELPSKEDRLTINTMLVKLADLGHILRPLDTHIKWSSQLFEEYLDQGDVQKALFHSVPALAALPANYDRNRINVGDLQVSYGAYVIKPMLDILFQFISEADRRKIESPFCANSQHWIDRVEAAQIAARLLAEYIVLC